MDKPLSLKKVQEIAGHKDPVTTMRYIHDDGIENTASRQWSRAKRRVLKAQGMQIDGSSMGHLQVVSSSES